MQNFKIRKTTAKDRKWVWSFIKGHWGSSLIIVHGKQYFADEIEGLIAVNVNGDRIGLITYDISENECQIVTLNSTIDKNGVGKALVDSVTKIAIKKKCKRLWLITTNDNIHALRFYQKHGFVISEIRINEIENSRKIKREIPKIGIDEIPIRDEIELEIKLNN
jgi:N-acetylglutamate synthase-like GNAT family acetyltransferase